MTEPSARLRSLIEPLVEGVGLYVFDLEQTGGKLIVTVDAPQGGVDMAAIADATKAISRALDEQDPIAGKYLLEVTSPGVERPLRTPAQFSWAVGKEVTVRLHAERDPAGGERAARRRKGVIEAADDDGVTLRTAEGLDTIAYDDIERARTVFDFEAELKAAKHDKPDAGPAAGRADARSGTGRERDA